MKSIREMSQAEMNPVDLTEIERWAKVEEKLESWIGIPKRFGK